MRRRILRATVWTITCVYAGMCIACRAIDTARGL